MSIYGSISIMKWTYIIINISIILFTVWCCLKVIHISWILLKLLLITIIFILINSFILFFYIISLFIFFYKLIRLKYISVNLSIRKVYTMILRVKIIRNKEIVILKWIVVCWILIIWYWNLRFILLTSNTTLNLYSLF